MTAPPLLSIGWIPYKITADEVWMKEIQNNEMSHRVDSIETGDLFMDSLKNEKLFSSLIRNMCKEFSSENALCLIEMVQFKESMFDYMRSTETIGDSVSGMIYIALFYDAVPKSTIVYEHKCDASDE